jgi:hypothetical protein
MIADKFHVTTDQPRQIQLSQNGLKGLSYTALTQTNGSKRKRPPLKSPLVLAQSALIRRPSANTPSGLYGPWTSSGRSFASEGAVRQN